MSGKRRWLAAAAAASMLLLAACGGSSGISASAAITPGSGQQQVGFPGTSGSPSTLPTAMPSSGMAGMPTAVPAGAATAKPVAADAVTIHNFAFGPQIVTVKAGTTVHWTNQDSEAHTVTSDTGAFNSPVLQPGTSYSFTFTRPGTFSYHCTIHPFMTAKVVVS